MKKMMSYQQVIQQMYWSDKARAYALGAAACLSLVVMFGVFVLVFALYDMPSLSITCGCAAVFFAFAMKVSLTNHAYARKRAGE